MVYDRLLEYEDLKYKDFLSSLVPNISKDSIIGVKSPNLKKIAKEINGTNEAILFLDLLPHKYLEENLIHMHLISMIKDFNKCIDELNKFLPYVNCWPVSDQSSPKVFKKNHDKLILIIEKWLNSDLIYTKRYGIRILMNEFLDNDFNKKYLEMVFKVEGEDYYLKMMKSWYFATALAKQYNDTIKYFENHLLDDFVHKKSIQKAIESYCVLDEHKKYLKTLRNI